MSAEGLILLRLCKSSTECESPPPQIQVIRQHAILAKDDPFPFHAMDIRTPTGRITADKNFAWGKSLNDDHSAIEKYIFAERDFMTISTDDNLQICNPCVLLNLNPVFISMNFKHNILVRPLVYHLIVHPSYISHNTHSPDDCMTRLVRIIPPTCGTRRRWTIFCILYGDCSR